MAKLEKANARKPLIENGAWWLRDSVDFSDKANPTMMYGIEIQEVLPPDVPFTTKRAAYTAMFTEEEMIAIATEWLSRYANGRARKRREAEDAKRREAARQESRHPGVPKA